MTLTIRAAVAAEGALGDGGPTALAIIAIPTGLGALIGYSAEK